MSKINDVDFFGFSGIENDAEFIPLITAEEEENVNKQVFPDELPILPLRNNVLFPGVVIPITVSREKSIQALNEANKTNKLLGVLGQKEDVQDPSSENIYRLGTIARILKMLKMPDGSTTVILQGRNRFQVDEILEETPYIKAKISVVADNRLEVLENEEFKATISNLKDAAVQITKLSPQLPNEASLILRNIENPIFLMHFIASNLQAELKDKQNVLSCDDIKERAEMVLKLSDKDLQLLELKNKIQSKTRTDIDKQQKEYFLNQQLKAIQEELGFDDNKQEIKNLKSFLSVQRDIARCVDVQFYKNQRFYNCVKKKYIKNRIYIG